MPVNNDTVTNSGKISLQENIIKTLGFTSAKIVKGQSIPYAFGFTKHS